MKSACVGVLSIIELKNAWWNIEIDILYIVYSLYVVEKWYGGDCGLLVHHIKPVWLLHVGHVKETE